MKRLNEDLMKGIHVLSKEEQKHLVGGGKRWEELGALLRGVIDLGDKIANAVKSSTFKLPKNYYQLSSK